MKTKFKRGIGALLSVAVIAGAFSAFPTNDVQAMELKIPERVRPTKETMWQPEHVGNTFKSSNQMGIQNTTATSNNQSLFITGVNTVKQFSDGQQVDVVGEDGVGVLTDVVAVTARKDTAAWGPDITPPASFALKEDGTVWAWGTNTSGELGDGTTAYKPIPVKVNELNDIVNISVGTNHSLFLKEDGTVWATGHNQYGQLGDGTNILKTSPVKVSGLNDIVSISAGDRHSLALSADGTVWGWGVNFSGQLGDGTTINKNIPVKVLGLTDIVDISSGENFSLALKKDGTAFSWGTNSYGQLGDGTTTSRSLPVGIKYKDTESFVTDVVSIEAGAYEGALLKSDGTVWNWGGSTASRNPKKIEDLSNIVAINLSEYSWSSYNNVRSNIIALDQDGKLYNSGTHDLGTKLSEKTSSNFGYTEKLKVAKEIVFDGQKQTTIIPQHMLYKFNNPKERELYEGGKSMPVNFELISDKTPVSFDIYYAPYEGWDDQTTWTEIAKGVPVSSLKATPYTSTVSNGEGGFFEGTKYEYDWNVPNEFIPHIRIIAVPTYQ